MRRPPRRLLERAGRLRYYLALLSDDRALLARQKKLMR